MIGFLKSIFTGDTFGAVERIASEMIETEKESAEAKALWVKTLDPNGIMRRQLSSFTCKAYGFYLLMAVVLILMHSFGVGDATRSKEAMEAITSLFVPITTAWGSIVAGSFGVNATNSIKGR